MGTDVQMIPNSDLSAHHDVIADRATSRNSDLRTNQILLTDYAIVADHDQVIYFGSRSD